MITIKSEAENAKEGMTLGEIAAFVGEAQNVGTPDDALVRVVTGFRSQIQSLQVPR